LKQKAGTKLDGKLTNVVTLPPFNLSLTKVSFNKVVMRVRILSEITLSM